MSLIQSKPRKRWFFAAHSVVSTKLKRQLDRALKDKERDDALIAKLEWRLAYNWYCGGRYSDAYPVLANICANTTLRKSRGLEITQTLSFKNLVTARCCLFLFYETKDHKYLKQSYNYYQTSIETMEYDLFAMFRLPMILLEFGRVMEHYGSFEPAMGLYSRVLSNFPNFRGYFIIMYRTAVTGKYIGEMQDKGAREQWLEKCIDILQFLLEALPRGICDVHIVLLYGLCLEQSTNASNRYRANGVYQALFDLCKRQRHPIVDVAYDDFKEWIAEPTTWLGFGDHAFELEEPLIARECYQIYVDRMMQNRKTISSEPVSVELYMKFARNCANFKNYSDAARYAEAALRQNHFNKEVRWNLSQWSPSHAAKLSREETAVKTIESYWRARLWLPGFRKRYAKIVVRDLETSLKKNYFNMNTREQLAYFAKEKWRPNFIFQEECARKIQKLFRHVRVIWMWQLPQRVKYTTLASDAFRQFGKTPYKRAVRTEIRRIATHKMCSRKHAIKKLIPLMDRQDNAVKVMMRGYKAYRFRMGIHNTIYARKHRAFLRVHQAATTIQSIIRMRAARIRINRYHAERKRYLAAVVRIQQFIRWRNSSFQHSVTRMLVRLQRKRQRAGMLLGTVLINKFRVVKERKREFKRRTRAARIIQHAFRAWSKRQREYFEMQQGAKRIQNLYRRNNCKKQQKISAVYFQKRKEVKYSSQAEVLMSSIYEERHFEYECPGVKQNTPQFETLLQRNTVYCTSDGEKFSNADCIMLSGVLRHKVCRIRRLVFHVYNASHANYEFDLLPAIAQCKSLRTLAILGGTWTKGFICGVLTAVQVENPRIQHVHIEGIEKLNAPTTHAIATSANQLLCDFFNYSIPGIQSLSLCNMRLSDADISLLGKGLETNTSIKHLALSFNFAEDTALIALFQGFMKNKKSTLTSIDLSWNLIKCESAVTQLFDSYYGPDLPGKCLEINLRNNQIRKPYLPRREYRMDLVVSCDMGPAPSPKKKVMKKANLEKMKTEKKVLEKLRTSKSPVPMFSSTVS